MSRTLLNVIVVNDEIYTHYINPRTDATFLERDEDGVTLYTIDSHAYMFEGSTMVGRFHLNDDRTWKVIMNDGREFSYGHHDLIKTEAKLFKDLLKAKVPV